MTGIRHAKQMEDPGDPVMTSDPLEHQLDLFAEPTTFADAIEGYLDQKVGVRQATIDEYRKCSRKLWRARPDLAELDVSDVGISHMLEIADLYHGEPGVHRAVRSTIAQALDWAAALRLRPAVNPARQRVAKGYKHRSKRPSRALIDAFFPSIDTCEQRSRITPMVGDLYRFATLSGLRHREICRLRLNEVDLDHGTVIVRMKKRGRWESIDEEVPIGPWAALILERRIAHARDGWVFPAPLRSGHVRHQYMWECWPPILRELEGRGVDVLDRVIGTKIVPTVTRSIAAKIRDRAGVSIIVSQRSMGHRRLQTTASYSPALEEEVREAMQIVEETLRKTVQSEAAPDDKRTDREKQLGRRISDRRRQLGMTLDEATARYKRLTNLELTRQGWMYWERNGCALKHVDNVAEVLATKAGVLLGFEH